LSALLELADDEFSNLKAQTEKVADQYSEDFERGEYDIELNFDSLTAFLDTSEHRKKWADVATNIGFVIPDHLWALDSERSFLLRVLRRAGMKRINDDLPYNIFEIPGETYSIVGQMNFCYNLWKLLQKKNYQIIHAKNPFSSIIPALSLQSSTKIIYDIRGLWIDFGANTGYIPNFLVPMFNQIEKISMKKSDAIIAISNELKKILLQKGIEKNKIKVILGDGVDVSTQRRQRDIRDDLRIEGKVVGYVGTISRSRFSNRIIEAFQRVSQQYHDKINLVMIGPFSKNEHK